MSTVRLARAALAWAILAVLVVGAPLALLVAAGSPLPDHLPNAHEWFDRLLRPDDGTLLLGALRLVAWTAWASFIVAVLLDAGARLRGLPAPRRLPGLGTHQRLASGLISAALLGAGSPAMAAPLPASAAVGMTAPHHHPVASPGAPGDQDVYRVRPGDTLSSIAEQQLGDADRWQQVWHLNQGQPQPDGAKAENPALIQPGWRLRLPDDTHKPAPKPHPHASHGHVAARPAQPSAHRPHPQSKPSYIPSSEHLKATQDGPVETRAPEVASALPTLSSALPQHAESAPHEEEARPTGLVTLQSGSMLAMSFAAGITTALAAGRLRRRRRHVPPPARQGVQITEEPPLAPAVRGTSRAHRRAEAAVLGDVPPPRDHERVRGAFSLAALTNLAIGIAPDGNPVEVDCPGLLLALNGSGRDDVARAIALAVLNESDASRARLVLPASDAERLFGEAAAGAGVPGLKITPDEDAAWEFMERHRRIRASLAATSSVDALRKKDPGEALPTLVLLGSLNPDDPRLRNLTQDATRYAMGAVLLSGGDEGTTCSINGEGAVTSVTGPLEGKLADSRLFQVTADDAPEFLRVIADFHTAFGDGNDPLTESDEAEPLDDSGLERSHLGVKGADVLVASSEQTPPEPVEDERVGSAPIRLRILGRPTVEADAVISLSSRSKSFEMLVYLALHPGATRLETCSALWPDHEPGDRFHSALRRLRDSLREATGSASRFVGADGDRYRIDAEVISVDLWDFQEALAATRRARSDAEHLAALERAADLCEGELADGALWEWLDEERYPLTRAQCDALAQLAELHEPDNPERALQILEKARTLDPDTEEIYRRIIKIQASLGRVDAANRTAHLLRKRLNEVGLEPDRKTLDLLKRIRGVEPRMS